MSFFLLETGRKNRTNNAGKCKLTISCDVLHFLMSITCMYCIEIILEVELMNK